MLFSFNWLSKHLNLKSKDPFKVADLITKRIAEVEAVTTSVSIPDSVVVGLAQNVQKHPNADKLQVAQVEVGKGKTLTIVCGAPNLKSGQKVAVALPGTDLGGGFCIAKRELRGVESNGMICSEDEIGLGSDHAGILVLDPKAKISEKLSTHLKLKSDHTIDIENKNMTHRPDLFSHQGLARELAVVFDQTFTPQPIPTIKEGKSIFKVTVKNPQVVPIYLAIQIDNIKVQPSPNWLQDSLRAIGQPPINNIVDAANFVMNDCGQPLHTFDTAKTPQITVRFAKSGEKITTLDKKSRTLHKDDIVITDGKIPIGIAGIMGGLDSAVSDSTNSIIIESANFDAVTARKTSKRLGLRTDALTRFEKSLDPNLTERGLKELTALILELCPTARIASKISKTSSHKSPTKKVTFTHDQLETLIGTKVSLKETQRILTTLGFAVKLQKDKWAVTFPSFRVTKDTGIFEDIVEEVARHIGYENIKPTPAPVSATAPIPNFERKLQRQISQIMVGAGFSETHNYAFLDRKTLEKSGFNPDKDAVPVSNPLSKEAEFLQPCLVPNMIQVVKKNEREFPDKLHFFTFDRKWTPDKNPHGTPIESKNPITETKEFMAMSANDPDAFSVFKGLAEQISHTFKIPDLTFKNQSHSNTSLFQSKVTIFSGNTKIGNIHQVGQISKSLNIKSQNIWGLMFYLKDLQSVIPQDFFPFNPIPEQPSVKRDLTFLTPKNLLAGDLQNLIKSSSSLLDQVTITNLFQGQGIPTDQKSLSFSLTFRSPSKTLTDPEVNSEITKIQTKTKSLKASLRT